ncbi:MAG: hypothetical protein AAF567_24390 [Actinomycetota bacterium]
MTVTIEENVDEEGVLTVQFIAGSDAQPHAATYAANAWIKERGWSAGPSCRSRFRGIIAKPGIRIAKWRNLTLAEQQACDGVLAGSGRDGPLALRIPANLRAEVSP